ncbi:MAG: hypothetical protein ACYDCP_07160 [Thermoplasmataceae archaeon]
MEHFRWVFELIDSMSGPAGRIKEQLDGVKGSLGGAGQATESLGGGFQATALKASVLAMGISSAIRIVESIGRAALDAAESIGRLAYGFARATIDSASFAETTKITFATILGSGAAAKQLMHDVVEVAAHLPITTQEAIGATTAFITSGFKTGEIKALLTVMSDVGVLNPGRSAESREMFVNEIRRVKNEGYLNSRIMYLLPQVTGISGAKIYEQLEKATGAKDMDAVRRLIEKRMISADQGVAAIQAAVAEMEGGKKGALSGQYAETVPGLMTTLKSRFLESTMDLADSPGFAQLKGFIQNLIEFTDTTTAVGKKIKAEIGDVFSSLMSAVFGDLSGETGKARIEAGIKEVLDFATALPPAISAAAEDVKALLKGVIGDVGELKTGWKGMLDPETIRGLKPLFKDLGEAIHSIAVDIMAIGHFADWIGKIAHVGWLATGGLATGATVDALTSILPGSAKHAAGGIVTSPQIGLIGEAGPEAIIPLDKLSGGGGGGISVSFGDIHIGGKGGEGDPALAQRIKEVVISALEAAFEGQAIEVGAS